MIHPDYLLPQLTSRQFAEWEAYFSDRPFGQDIENHMLAQLACMLQNRWRPKGAQPVKVEDMIPRFKQQQQTPEEMKLALRRIIGGNR